MNRKTDQHGRRTREEMEKKKAAATAAMERVIYVEGQKGVAMSP